MPGVIFLDFDGPIFPSKVFIYPENNGDIATSKCKELNLHPYVTYWKADPNSIAMLNQLYEIYPYDLVISSSWADDWLHQKEHIDGVLFSNNLNYTLHTEWRTPRDRYNTRHEQIGHWLRKHPDINNYIVIDDTSSGDMLDDADALAESGINPKSVFLVDIDEGISYKNYKEIRDIVRCW